MPPERRRLQLRPRHRKRLEAHNENQGRPRGRPWFGTMRAMDTEKATFAAGCFWGVEAAFRSVPGAVYVISGYTGGHTINPTYEKIWMGGTGHAEAVEVIFDPSKVSYETLVRKFFAIHNPTEWNRQGPDIGDQYRSAIFYHSPEQRVIAERVKQEVALTHIPQTIATSIEPAQEFWHAEEYHQRYAEKHPDRVVCHA